MQTARVLDVMLMEIAKQFVLDKEEALYEHQHNHQHEPPVR